MTLRIYYRANGHYQFVDYIDGNLEPVVEQLGRESLSTSTQSLILKQLSTWEDLMLHQERGFEFCSMKTMP